MRYNLFIEPSVFFVRLKNKILRFLGWRLKWSENEYFDEKWKTRIHFMSKYIKDGSSVLDLGCGKMWLRQMVNDMQYYPVDYCDRGGDTIICDFNKKEFPERNADVAFVSGSLEYVKDYSWFIQMIATHSTICVLSYCILDDFPNIRERRRLAWVNDLSKKNLIDLFERNKMSLQDYQKTEVNHHIFVFAKEKQYI